jgi:hypothetical protein
LLHMPPLPVQEDLLAGQRLSVLWLGTRRGSSREAEAVRGHRWQGRRTAGFPTLPGFEPYTRQRCPLEIAPPWWDRRLPSPAEGGLVEQKRRRGGHRHRGRVQAVPPAPLGLRRQRLVLSNGGSILVIRCDGLGTPNTTQRNKQRGAELEPGICNGRRLVSSAGNNRAWQTTIAYVQLLREAAQHVPPVRALQPRNVRPNHHLLVHRQRAPAAPTCPFGSARRARAAGPPRAGARGGAAPPCTAGRAAKSAAELSRYDTHFCKYKHS